MSNQSDANQAEREARDGKLIRRIAAGDSSALDELLRAHAAGLFNAALRVVGSEDLAQDAVQDTFIKLWNARTTINIRASVAAYLYRAVRNRAINIRDHETAQRSLESRLMEQQAGEREHLSGAEDNDPELMNAIEGALLELSPGLREVFLLRADQGLSYAEIAESLEITDKSVRMQMYRATKALAERLKRWL